MIYVLFNSIEFLIFLPIVMILYFVIPKKYRFIVLLLASYVFYAFWNINLIFLIVGTTLVSFLCGIGIEMANDKKKRKLFLVINIVVSLGMLVFFKYFNFLADSFVSIVNVFNGDLSDISLSIILPVGISFYTFQTLSYAFDIYSGKIKAEKNIGYYALYVSFFPQLVAGPIERPENLLPQLKVSHSFSLENLAKGAKYMLAGFFKKIVIADVISIYVNYIFNDVSNANGLLILIGSMLFAVQILCDFSGYSDIAVGVAKIFGIDLMKNFDKPYHSKSIKEFWSRWHISLSTWFRDYIYFPMGGSRCSKWRWALNILVVFLVSGLWHGAAWTFVIWGLIHGIYQIVGKLTLKLRDSFWDKLHFKSIYRNSLRIIVTFLLVSFAWICFRANSLADLGTLYSKLFTDWNLDCFTYAYNFLGLDILKIVWILGLIIALNFIDLVKIDYDSSNTWFYILRKAIYVIIIWAIIASWIYLRSNDVPSDFIYFQF